MIKNYFITAYRNILRNKGYAIINISGLAIGIAACLLIFLVVRYELSYDKFQPNYSEIYHVVTEDKSSDGIKYTSGIPYPALEALRTDLPQVKTGALFSSFGSQITVPDASGKTPGKKLIEEEGLFFSDPEFFEIFNYKWLAGNTKTLSEPNNIVLTKSIAEKYFGDWKISVGKTIRVDNAMDFKVSGILEDVPLNSDFRIRIVGSFITVKNNRYYGYTTDWGNITSNFQLFMLLPKNLSRSQISAQLKDLSIKYNKDGGASERVNILQPLSEIHSDNRIHNLTGHYFTSSTMLTLSLIAFLIISMACINFINLSTAQAVGRSKEVGVRKVLGSNRVQLFFQMMGETKLVVIFAAILSIGIAYFSLPYIKHIISIQENLNLFNAQSLLFFILVIVVVTILSGIYPALILSGFKPVVALKNKVSSATIGGISLRRGLVVAQFAISQVLVIGTIVAVGQINFIRSADLGFNKEALLVLNNNSDSAVLARLNALKQDLRQVSGVKMISCNSSAPSSNSNWGTNFAFDHHPDENFTLFLKYGDEEYFKTFGLEFLAGHGYSKSDTVTEVVINETLLKKLKMKNPNEAIGKEIRMGGGRWKPIVGVVKDFKTNSLREEISPIVICSRKRFYGQIAIKLNSANIAKAKKDIEGLWDKHFPEYAFSSFFVDESIQRFYEEEEQMALLYKIFAGLAIFISCLGLYGLVSFMAVQRTKEVGIRKVLGAGIGNIMYLFSKEFLILILIAFVIAAPLGYYLMNNWLQNFVFRIDIGAGVFVIAVVTSVLVAGISVGYKALRAAIANPVKSLRTE